MRKLKLLLVLLSGLGCMSVHAQIGYQMALLNTATGEARANETVSVSVSLSNNEGLVFYTETKSATTNDFGILSLSIGNADTFKDVDLSKMPFFIEVTANGVMIGKSQMLSVPVAEVAKIVAPIEAQLVLGEWTHYYHDSDRFLSLVFYERGRGIMNYDGETNGFSYEIEGKTIFVYYDGDDGVEILRYFNSMLYAVSREYNFVRHN